jgi:hypothetical protein
MSISDGLSGFTIKDYAFNSKPEQGILAGQSSYKYLGIVPISDLDVYFCTGNSVTVPYMILGNFSATNVVTVELSDAGGSFANPVSIGNVVSNASGSVNAVIPPRTPSGNGYRIRVRSSDPVRTSYSTGFYSTVLGPAIGSINAADTTLCQHDSVYLSAYYADGWCYSYQWKRNGIDIPGATMSYYYATVAGKYKCIISNAGVNVTSNTITITACSPGAISATKSSKSNGSQSTRLNEVQLKVAPNPATTSAIISFSLPVAGKVSLKLYDINGRLINVLSDKELKEGIHQITLNTRELSGGIYTIRMQTHNSFQTGKLVVVR